MKTKKLPAVKWVTISDDSPIGFHRLAEVINNHADILDSLLSEDVEGEEAVKNGVMGKFAGYRVRGKTYNTDGEEVAEKHEKDCFCCRGSLFTPQKPSWESEFDEKFGGQIVSSKLASSIIDFSPIKSFISKTREEAKAEERESLLNEIISICKE